jgi:hypothetical protein
MPIDNKNNDFGHNQTSKRQNEHLVGGVSDSSYNAEDFSIIEEEGEGDYGHEQKYSAGSLFRDLQKGQKIALASLAFFSLIFFIAWGVNLKNNIYGPFQMKESAVNDSLATSADTADKSENALKTQDTDKDGLNDWDEANIYSTSLYLDDTDSDGFKDKEEIDSGNDPNCPEGQNCSADQLASPDASPNNSANSGDGLGADTASTSEIIGGIAEPEQVLTAAEKQAISDGLGKDVNAATLREMLLSAGMQKEILDQISDEDLVQSYQETMK